MYILTLGPVTTSVFSLVVDAVTVVAVVAIYLHIVILWHRHLQVGDPVQIMTPTSSKAAWLPLASFLSQNFFK